MSYIIKIIHQNSTRIYREKTLHLYVFTFNSETTKALMQVSNVFVAKGRKV
jgi:hypothetical protein